MTETNSGNSLSGENFENDLTNGNEALEVHEEKMLDGFDRAEKNSAIVDFIVGDGTEKTTDGNWITSFHEIPNELGSLPYLRENTDDILDLLTRRIRVMSVEPLVDGFEINYDLAFCPHLKNEAGIAVYEQTQKEERLYDRLDKNLSDYIDRISQLEKSEIIGLAGEIVAMNDAHFFLQESYSFEPDEVDFLMRFENPLTVVADSWQQRTGDISDMYFAVEEVFDKQNALADYPLYIETTNNGTYLQKFEDVDVLKTLNAIAHRKIVHHPNDIKTDIDIIPKLAASGDPEKRMLLWHVSDYGTHVNPERDTFVADTGAYGTWTNYLRPGMLSYAIEITDVGSGIVKGNIYELNHEAHIAHVKETALSAHSVMIHYEDGRVQNVSRQHFDDNRTQLMVDNGNVATVRHLPRYENEMTALLSHERHQREQTPTGNIIEHVYSLEHHAKKIEKPSIREKLVNAAKQTKKQKDPTPQKQKKKEEAAR